jgi:hypothetical protein
VTLCWLSTRGTAIYKIHRSLKLRFKLSNSWLAVWIELHINRPYMSAELALRCCVCVVCYRYELPTRHQVVGNMVIKPHGSAIWFDGIGTVVASNTIVESDAGSILHVGSLATIVGNAVHNANMGEYPTGNHGVASTDSTIVSEPQARRARPS